MKILQTRTHMPPNGLELSSGAGLLRFIFVQLAASGAARARVKSPTIFNLTGQRHTFYTLSLILRELALVIKRIFAFSSHRLSFRRLFTQTGEWLDCSEE